MTVNTGVKGTLARLLATEDLVVEHKNCETASFDVARRILTLPNWEKATEEVYDLLVAHEVGHALFTPNRLWDQLPCPKSIINVTEDARIEKLMKRKYGGLPKTFYKGYKELDAMDFFMIPDDQDEINLVDKINLHFKSGAFTPIDFAPEHEYLVDLTGNAETFEDAVEAAVEIYKVMQDIEKQKEQEKLAETEEGEEEGGNPQGGSGQGESMTDDIDTSDQPSDEGQMQQQQQEGQAQGGTSGGVDYDPFHSQTDEAFTQGTKDLTQEPRYGRENMYVELPKKLNPDHFIVGTDYLLNVNRQHFNTENELKEESQLHSYEQTITEYNNFYKKSQKEVNYLVKEFECKKAASSYARARTSRTGVLDTSKLHTYKFTDDIFKKVTVLPEGKNHGMIFLLDWSGSMSNNIRETVEQVIQLSWFCKKVNIPFDVYAFTNDGFAASYRMDICGLEKEDYNYKTLHEPVVGEFALENGFTLLNVVSSKQKKKDFEESLKYLYINATANNFRSYYSFKNGFAVSYQTAPGFGLSGTPLNEALVLMKPLVKEFFKKIDKLTLCVLTDGEGQCSSYYSGEHTYNNRPYANTLGYNCLLRDRKLGRTYEKFDGSDKVTEILLQNLRETYPSLSVIGFRLLGSRDGYSFFSRTFEYDQEPMEKAQKAYRKDKYVAITHTGYHKLFVMPSNNQSDTEELWDDIKEDSTRAEITRTFKKMFKNKKSNKKMHNSFIETVA
tara:strand:- start:9382 stop:11562 length:2181 start_codon:yes stop_codon:yes gene_type:complete